MLDGWTAFTDAGILSSGTEERNQSTKKSKIKNCI
jgi:hypothetical protein